MLLLGVAFSQRGADDSPPSPLTRTSIALPEGQKLASGGTAFPLALSLDGARLAYVAEEEGRTLLHAAFQSSASLTVTATELRITLAAQSSPHRSEALAKLCQELDQEAVCYPGSRLRVRLAVKGQKPLTP